MSISAGLVTTTANMKPALNTQKATMLDAIIIWVLLQVMSAIPKQTK